MGGLPAPRNKGRNIPPGQLTLSAGQGEKSMAGDREKISNGPNEEAINETIAGTGPGIPDDAQAAGEQAFRPPSDEEVAKIAEKLGAPLPERETAPVDGE
jgi:hypothetical protein